MESVNQMATEYLSVNLLIIFLAIELNLWQWCKKGILKDLYHWMNTIADHYGIWAALAGIVFLPILAEILSLTLPDPRKLGPRQGS